MNLSDEEKAVIEARRQASIKHHEDLAKTRAALEEALHFQPRLAIEYTTDEKCVVFDALHAYALSLYQDILDQNKKRVRSDLDRHNAAYTQLMELLRPTNESQDLWNHINNLDDLLKRQDCLVRC